MRSPTRIATAAIATTALLAAGCGDSSDDDEAAADGPVSVEVSIDAGLEPEARKAFDDQVAIFQEQNPDITVTPREYTWTGTTFAAELAGGTLPDVFTVPFTDGKSLIEQEQIADISPLVKELPYADKFNADVVANGQNADGDIVALPTEAYGQALHYNRTLFTEAGLDPDSPPTTWDEVREAAKAISDKTDAAGYASMTKDNTGGWILTSLAYALGGRAQTGEGDSVEATVDTQPYKDALQMVRDMRWTDDAMGSNFLYDWNEINQAFASGQVGMYISGGGNYASLVSQNDLKPADYGETVVPLEGDDAGTLGGGTLAAVSATASETEQAAAVKWIDYYYMSKRFEKEAAQRDAKTQAASDQPIGAPQVPVFDQATYEESLVWIDEYINVPVEQMEPYTSQQFDQPLLTEPTVATQEIYGLLDPVVQAVLTDENADVDALLASAQESMQSKIDSAN